MVGTCSRALTGRVPGWAALLLLPALWLSGCATRAPSGTAERDGVAAQTPAGLERVGGPNKPYDVQGQLYAPHTSDVALREQGGASWYGRKFHGKPTSSGEPYDMFAMSAAHRTMPIPSFARVRNPANGREVIVRVNDRGPFVAGRVIDLSYTAALKLGVLNAVTPVVVERITFDEIRRGRWQREAQADDPRARELLP
jgi:rare lipoprotein A